MKKQKKHKKHHKVVKHRKQTHAMVIAKPPTEPWKLSIDEVTLIKNQICPGATDKELELCLITARRRRLDPFRGEIWFIPRWDRHASNGEGKPLGRNKWIPVVSIYGLCALAARDHKDFGTYGQPEYGPVITIEREGKKFKGPEWCRVAVYKKGIDHPGIGEVFFEEILPQKASNCLFWDQMDFRMMAKCAKAQGTRENYPSTGGLYIPEEMYTTAGDLTPNGRLITRDGVTPSGIVANQREFAKAEQKRILDEKLSHGHDPGSARAQQAEATLARVEEEDRRLREARNVTPKASEASPAENAPAAAQEPALPPIPERDLGDVWSKDDKRKEEKPKGGRAPATLSLLNGTIQKTTSTKMVKGGIVLNVQIGKIWYACYHIGDMQKYLAKGVGFHAEVYLNKQRAIDGIKRIGKINVAEDGRTPILRREPGSEG